ncbi:UDP-3-O-acyl-N-acetylglucosamine deacetylase [Nitrospinota bacterium]
MDKGQILIVDDEESILSSLEGILEDEGYRTLKATSGEIALDLVRAEMPDVVLVDVWMPGIDGIKTLQAVKDMHPDAEVVVMSGHGTIDTAVAATKLGAFDFIEKPLSMESVLRVVGSALKNRRLKESQAASHIESRPNGRTHPSSVLRHGPKEAGSRTDSHVAPLSGSFESHQRTIGRSVVLYGRGLHSGLKTGLILEPLPPGSGIRFGSLTTQETVAARAEFVDDTRHATNLRNGQVVARTIEHLMSALHAYGVSNLLVKLSEEVPIMDGSAVEFCHLIEDAGLEDQPDELPSIVVDQVLEVSEPGAADGYIRIEPGEGLTVSYMLDLPAPVGKQTYEYRHRGVENYQREIAPARTFSFIWELEALEEMGLGEGGRWGNFILIDNERVVNTELRFSDEFVRHKILDIMGDLYLLGRPIQGKVTAQRTGHRHNVDLVRLISEAFL